MSSYPPPDNVPPNYGQPEQPYAYPPDQQYGTPPNYAQPGQSAGYPPANPYGAPPGYTPAAPYGTPPGYPAPNQPYGTPGMPYVYGAPPSNGLATASLILGILIIIAGIFTGIPAVITGHMALARIKENPMVPGRGMAIAGLILGYISIGLTALFILLLIVIASTSGSINTTS